MEKKLLIIKLITDNTYEYTKQVHIYDVDTEKCIFSAFDFEDISDANLDNDLFNEHDAINLINLGIKYKSLGYNKIHSFYVEATNCKCLNEILDKELNKIREIKL